jgi:predicted ATPase
VLGLLSRLVDKSLVLSTPHGEESRYRMLETVLCYAAERLSESGEEAILRDRHAGFFLELAEEAEPELLGGQQSVWLERLDAECARPRARERPIHRPHRRATRPLRIGCAPAPFATDDNYMYAGRACIVSAM